MTERSVPDWLDSLTNDPAFGQAVWNSLIWVDPVEVVGVNVAGLVRDLKLRWFRDTLP